MLGEIAGAATINVFISHARSEADDIRRFTSDFFYALKEHSDPSVDVWIDEHTLEPEDRWAEEIKKGLINCDAGIILLSEGSNEERRDWVVFEATTMTVRKLIDPAFVIRVIGWKTNGNQTFFARIQPLGIGEQIVLRFDPDPSHKYRPLLKPEVASWIKTIHQTSHERPRGGFSPSFVADLAKQLVGKMSGRDRNSLCHTLFSGNFASWQASAAFQKDREWFIAHHLLLRDPDEPALAEAVRFIARQHHTDSSRDHKALIEYLEGICCDPRSVIAFGQILADCAGDSKRTFPWLISIVGDEPLDPVLRKHSLKNKPSDLMEMLFNGLMRFTPQIAGIDLNSMKVKLRHSTDTIPNPGHQSIEEKKIMLDAAAWYACAGRPRDNEVRIQDIILDKYYELLRLGMNIRRQQAERARIRASYKIFARNNKDSRFVIIDNRPDFLWSVDRSSGRRKMSFDAELLKYLQETYPGAVVLAIDVKPAPAKAAGVKASDATTFFPRVGRVDQGDPDVQLTLRPSLLERRAELMCEVESAWKGRRHPER